jgi:hypothetical protein
MESMRLKLKIGDHEFDAEGPSDVVQAQFASWRDLIAALPAVAVQLKTPAQPERVVEQPQQRNGIEYDKIMKQDGRFVSLTARGESLEDELILLLLGQKQLRANDSVTGTELIEGLRQTGRTVNRIDYQLDKMSEAGDVITIGQGRARRYRLTNTGLNRAQDIARTLLAKVA